MAGRIPAGRLLLAAGLLLARACCMTIQFPNCSNSILAATKACDPSASPAERAVAVVSAMNITEKLVNLVDKSLGAPRIGLPPYMWWSEALHGVASSPGVTFSYGTNNCAAATSFANPITLSAAYDDLLVRAVADVVSTEARAFSNGGCAGLDYWTPNINPYKDPRWGRGAETPGEDAFRIKQYVKSLIDGLEQPTLRGTRKIIATCKHYAAYDLERWKGIKRYAFDAVVSLQDLAEYYLPPFQQCARDSNVGSIMCSYNSVNGTPACANTYLMDTVLRKHWNWTSDSQYITSDCNAVDNFHNDHHWTKTAAESAGKAYTAGTDTVCEYNTITDVKSAYSQGLLSEATIDRALKRLYEGLVRVGYFDSFNSSTLASLSPSSPPVFAEYRSLTYSKDVNTPYAQSLALQSAADGLVLKKNLDATLPLIAYGPGQNKTLALIGHWAGAETSLKMLGNYAGIPPLYRAPSTAAAALGLKYTWAPGPVAQNSSARDSWTSNALVAAAGADAILYFGGTDLTMAAEDHDRDSIALPSAQVALVNRLCAAAAASSPAKPCVVLQLGDQTDDTPLLQNSNVSAVLWAGYPGQDGGLAVLQAVLGLNGAAPAGRLPVTVYPASYVDQVPLTDMRLRPSPGASPAPAGSGAAAQIGSNPGRTYRWYDKAVLPFGTGLHYSDFKVQFGANLDGNKGGLKFDIASILSGCTVPYPDTCLVPSIDISVTNLGTPRNLTSDFIALLFLRAENISSAASPPGPPGLQPLKTLIGYNRMRGLVPGETRRGPIELTLAELSRVDAAGNTAIYPGKYTLILDVPTSDELPLELLGQETGLVKWPQPG